MTFIEGGLTFSGASAVIPRELVAEIRIHHHLRMDDAGSVPTEALFSGIGAGWIIWLTPVALITYAVTAPPAMAVEGIRRLLPDKVIKVAP